jgi:hypothetical protein
MDITQVILLTDEYSILENAPFPPRGMKISDDTCGKIRKKRKEKGDNVNENERKRKKERKDIKLM